MKTNLNIFILILVSISLFSCQKNNKIKTHKDTGVLYNKSIDLYHSYIDSLKTVTDSLKIMEMLDNFEKKITAINFEVEPETDFYLSPQEKDSLIKLAAEYSRVRKEAELRIKQKDPYENASR